MMIRVAKKGLFKMVISVVKKGKIRVVFRCMIKHPLQPVKRPRVYFNFMWSGG